jgi:hypothetical protein
MFIGERCGVLKYIPEVFIEHLHYSTGKSPIDASYMQSNSSQAYLRDEAAYEKWVNDRGLEIVRKINQKKSDLKREVPSGSMKIAAVSLVNNECDIIELFIRINSRCVDDFYIIDNGSSDSTVAILLKLIDEGFPITIWKFESIDFQQSFVISNAIRNIYKIKRYDFIVPLDADEFLDFDKDSISKALSVLDENTCGLMHSNNYVPVSEDFHSAEAPLFTLFRKRKSEDTAQNKVVIPYNLAQNAIVLDGASQACDSNLSPFSHKRIDACISHVPIRSSQQLITKLLIGTAKLSIKTKERNGEGLWWDILSKKVRENNYSISYKMLLEFALSYGLNTPSDTFQEDTSIGKSTDTIIYRDESFINKDKRYWVFVDQMCKEIRSLRFDNN